MINAEVESKRRKHKVKTPVQVAILDTGFNRALSTLQDDEGKVRCVTRDFTSPSTVDGDTMGHGTLMIRLVTECAPSAEVIVARVARSTKELDGSQDKIAQAIRWAGCDCEADIISMSFGFPRDHAGISEAIQKVQSKRKGAVIFLASAGNSPSEDESFSARHPSVISIYATNCHGTFAESNARYCGDGPAVLSTFGDDIPESIHRELGAKYPNACQPGSSVATAVAAGISATMLCYATVLPSLVGTQGQAGDAKKGVLGRLWESKGMEALLHRMAEEKPGRRRFVNPISFWMDKRCDDSKYAAIYDCVSAVDNKCQG